MTQLLHNPNGLPAFDVVHVEHLRGAWYALKAENLVQGRIPVIWDSVDCISLLFQLASRHSKSLFGRWGTRLELDRTRRYEMRITPRFNRVLVTSEMDKQALAELAGANKNIEVLGNGVDLNTFRPTGFELRSPNNLVVSGKMSYHANVTMVVHLIQEIMPQIWSHRPDVTLTIVGKDPVSEIQDLAQHPLITLTGTVPEIAPYLQQAAIAVAPLTYGVGIQNKVLEAMACATPVITTSQVLNSLKARPGEELMVADNPETFAGAVIALLADEHRRRTMGAAGRGYVQTHHNWSTIAGRLAEIYREEINKINGINGIAPKKP